MPARPILTVPQPCHENWSAMTPANQGRHCAACNKVVVDFTRMSDAELLGYMKRQPATSCGRFTAKQINRPLVVPAAATPWRRWLAAVALALGLSEVVASSARAQAPASQLGQQPEPVENPSITNTAALAPNQASVPNTSVLVQGRVLDGEMGLPGVTVQLQGTHIGTNTDSEGYFRLFIAKEAAASDSNLVFSFVGFETQQVAVPRNGEMKVVLAENVLGGLEYAPLYNPIGWWQRLSSLFRR